MFNIIAEVIKNHIPIFKSVKSIVNLVIQIVDIFIISSIPINYVISYSEYNTINQSNNMFVLFRLGGVYQFVK